MLNFNVNNYRNIVMLLFEVFIFQQSKDMESYQNSEFLGTLLALCLWESLLCVAYLNKWGLILYLFWSSDEKPFLNIIKIYQTTHYTVIIYTVIKQWKY